MDALKRAMRQEIARRVEALGAEERSRASLTACRMLVSLNMFKEAESVLAFAPMPDEIDTAHLMRACLDAGKRLYLPLVRWKSRQMEAVEVADLDGDIVLDKTGIPGPRPGGATADGSEIDLVVVPGRAFDFEGGRLGRGGGFYDRLLAGPGRRRAVVIAFNCQMVEKVPVSEHDVPIDVVVTELGAIFTAKKLT